MDVISRNLISLYVWLGQTAATTPTSSSGTSTSSVDPGNDPTFTAIMYVVFMLVLIGGGTLFFKVRLWLMRRATSRPNTDTQASSETKYGKS